MTTALTTWSRRDILKSMAMTSIAAALPGASAGQTSSASLPPYGLGTLPAGIRSRVVSNVNGITFHVLEAGYEPAGRPGVLLVHGFPELAYSWRKIMIPLAQAGFHVIAPDQRGYGRSGGTEVKFDDDLSPFSTLNHVRDMLGIVAAFGFRSLAVVGHDYGSPVAAWCALTRPDVFRAVALMSAPFGGAPTLPFNTADQPPKPPMAPIGRNVDADLAALPVPRKHYQAYYAAREANENMWHPPQGIHDFLRGYYHFKSADWKENQPHPLTAYSAPELAKLPRYYVMDRDKGMAETVAAVMPSPDQIAACKWLPDAELRVYSTEYGRTGFQGGLESYRIGQDPKWSTELTLFAGRTIDVPSVFISGKSDWGVYQRAGSLEAMQKTACTQMKAVHLLDGAGHWVQQEQPAEVSRLLLEFLRATTATA